MHVMILAEAIRLMPDGTLLLHIAIILLMIYVLNRTLFKPINNILAEREEMARTGKGTAAEIMKRVEAGMNNYEQTLQQARLEGYRLIEQARAEATQQRQSAIEAVRGELARLVDEHQTRLNEQTSMARAVLEAEAKGIATRLKKQILG